MSFPVFVKCDKCLKQYDSVISDTCYNCVRTSLADSLVYTHHPSCMSNPCNCAVGKLMSLSSNLVETRAENMVQKGALLMWTQCVIKAQDKNANFSELVKTAYRITLDILNKA